MKQVGAVAVIALLTMSCRAFVNRMTPEGTPGCGKDRTAALDELKRGGPPAAVSIAGRWRCVNESDPNHTRELWTVSQTENRVTVTLANNHGGNGSLSGSVSGHTLLFSMGTIGDHEGAGRMQIDGGAMKGWEAYDDQQSGWACQRDVITCTRS